jgi:hypothetical protein
MKAYLAVTGIIAEWNYFVRQPGHLTIIAAIGAVAAGLAIWAWRLFRIP